MNIKITLKYEDRKIRETGIQKQKQIDKREERDRGKRGSGDAVQRE